MGPGAADSREVGVGDVKEPTRLTAIFTRRPAPGRAKTRLSPPLEPAAAAALAEGMLRDAVERCRASSGFRTVLLHTPAGEGPWFAARFPGLRLRPQRGPDLAERLANAFADLLEEEGVETLVAIGSDQPLVGAARIVEAHRALEEGADLVLGPDLGGGYYLVGMRAPHPELFTRVEMSTDGMCAATVRLAEERGLAVRLLATGYDVDVGADVERLRADLDRWRARGGEDEADFPRHTAAILLELVS